MPADPSGELAAKPLPDLMLVYGNWRSRFIRPQPRVPHLSSKLQASAKLGPHMAAIDDIVRSIEAGDDLTPRLSRSISTAYEAAATRATRLDRRGDLDLLIADWGLHHLHLGTTTEPDGFVTRTGDLLFAGFSDDDAYLLGIYPHGSWALKELIEILVTEWPSNPLVASSLSGFGFDHPPSDEQHLQARKGGVFQFVEVNGTMYIPGGGMTTAGTPVDVTMRRNAIMDMLDDLRGSLSQVLSELDQQFPPRDSSEVWEPALDGDTLALKRGSAQVPIADLW